MASYQRRTDHQGRSWLFRFSEDSGHYAKQTSSDKTCINCTNHRVYILAIREQKAKPHRSHCKSSDPAQDQVESPVIQEV